MDREISMRSALPFQSVRIQRYMQDGRLNVPIQYHIKVTEILPVIYLSIIMRMKVAVLLLSLAMSVVFRRMDLSLPGGMKMLTARGHPIHQMRKLR